MTGRRDQAWLGADRNHPKVCSFARVTWSSVHNWLKPVITARAGAEHGGSEIMKAGSEVFLVQPKEGVSRAVGDLETAKRNAVGDRRPIAQHQIGGHLQLAIRG